MTYHHGDLRAALVAAAVAEVETHGAGAVSLRRLAGQIGVTPAAIYHHLLAVGAFVDVTLVTHRQRA